MEGLNLSETTIYIIGFTILAIEYVLGSTTLVKPNSIIESVLHFLKKILETLGVKKSK